MKFKGPIVEQFAPRFANGGVLLYLGDTAKRTYMLIDKRTEKTWVFL